MSGRSGGGGLPGTRHGRGVLLGSVSHYVVRHAPCSVLVKKRSPVRDYRTLLGLDGSTHSDAALQWLGGIALLPETRIRVVIMAERSKASSTREDEEPRVNGRKIGARRENIDGSRSLLCHDRAPVTRETKTPIGTSRPAIPLPIGPPMPVERTGLANTNEDLRPDFLHALDPAHHGWDRPLDLRPPRCAGDGDDSVGGGYFSTLGIPGAESVASTAATRLCTVRFCMAFSDSAVALNSSPLVRLTTVSLAVSKLIRLRFRTAS